MNAADIFAAVKEVPKPEIKEISQKVELYIHYRSKCIFFYSSWMLPPLKTFKIWQWNTVNCYKTVVSLSLSIAL